MQHGLAIALGSIFPLVKAQADGKLLLFQYAGLLKPVMLTCQGPMTRTPGPASSFFQRVLIGICELYLHPSERAIVSTELHEASDVRPLMSYQTWATWAGVMSRGPCGEGGR